MKQKTYRLCLLSMVLIALAVGIYYYNHMERRTTDRSGTVLAMEEAYE